MNQRNQVEALPWRFILFTLHMVKVLSSVPPKDAEANPWIILNKALLREWSLRAKEIWKPHRHRDWVNDVYTLVAYLQFSCS